MDAERMAALIAAADLPLDPAAMLSADPSVMELFAARQGEARLAWLARQPSGVVKVFANGGWEMLARGAQRPPPGDWRTWLILAGRGFGKTRAGAEWVMDQVRRNVPIRIALVAQTIHEGRSVMIEGESGILAIARGEWRPEWESSNRRLFWKETGAQAFLYSASEPESLRGPQHHHAWCDEIAKWPRAPEVWRNLAFGLRLGGDPRLVATTTPRAVPLIRRLVAEARAGAGVALTTGRMTDNRAHLARVFIDAVERRYGGTLTGRQEIDGELIEEIEGALWSRALIEGARVEAAPAARLRTVIGVDPPAGAGASSDACGIVVAALAEGPAGGGAAYVLEDASVRGASPERWARAVADAAARWAADRVIAEVNNGGAMVESVLRAADAGLPIATVHAAQGKAARAEPVQALYEGGRAFHAGVFPALEDELCGLMAGGGYEGPGRSPDRADALVWAMHELMLGPRRARPGVRRL